VIRLSVVIGLPPSRLSSSSRDCSRPALVSLPRTDLPGIDRWQELVFALFTRVINRLELELRDLTRHLLNLDLLNSKQA
jgi:hypothetical protein